MTLSSQSVYSPYYMKYSERFSFLILIQKQYLLILINICITCSERVTLVDMKRLGFLGKYDCTESANSKGFIQCLILFVPCIIRETTYKKKNIIKKKTK